MATTDGASPASSRADDTVLSGALAEMVSEGADLNQPFESSAGTEEASQTAGAASAAPAPSPATGDGGSGPVDAGTTTAASAVPGATAAPSAGATPAADPLAGTEPLTVEVNGTTRTLPWAHRVPGEGVLLTEAEVPQLQQLVEQRDSLERVTREYAAKNADFERLSTWDVEGPEGKRTLTGRDGLEAMRVSDARSTAAIGVLDAMIAGSPTAFIGLNDKNEVVWNPTAISYLQKDVMLAADAAEKQTRAHLSKVGSVPSPTSSASAPSPSATATPAEIASAAPAIIAKAAGSQLSVLTAQDREFLADQVQHYLRTVTENDRIFSPNLRLGASIVSEKFAKVVQHQIASRTAANTQAKVAETAGKHNAGMDKGRQPAPKAPPKPATPTTTPATPVRAKADWDGPLSSALTEMGISR